jgi:four helix bundle protein
MTTTSPQHSLRTYGIALELVKAVHETSISNAHLRDQAMRAAQSCALNTAEGAGRLTKADKARAFTIARGECVEACAAVEIASVCGQASAARYAEVSRITSSLYGILTKLIR